jgi:hypothetical protein
MQPPRLWVCHRDQGWFGQAFDAEKGRVFPWWVRMRSGAKVVFFNIAVLEKNGQRVVEGTELESDLEELHSDSIASQRKGTHKIQTQMFCLY